MEVKSLRYDVNCVASVALPLGIHVTVLGICLCIHPSYYLVYLCGQQAKEER